MTPSGELLVTLTVQLTGKLSSHARFSSVTMLILSKTLEHYP